MAAVHYLNPQDPRRTQPAPRKPIFEIIDYGTNDSVLLDGWVSRKLALEILTLINRQNTGETT